MSDTHPQYAKIASAIYLITSFFPEQEPLKWRLRTLSTDLVSDLMKDKARIGREVMSLFHIAQSAGLVSDQNHDILTRELARIVSE